MKTYKIAVIGGDGTGPEVTRESVKVLKAAAGKYNFGLDLHDYDLGADRYNRTGETLPPAILEELRKHDAILLGAIGHPSVKPGILEKGILLALRFELDQYINLRPVKLLPGVDGPLKNKGPEDIDYVIVRENGGGLYTGAGGVSMRNTPHEVAIQDMVYTRHQVDRCLKYAFELARSKRQPRPWKGLTEQDKAKGLVGALALSAKTNVLTFASDLWERAFHEMGKKDYPDIRRDYYHVDATCMWMVKNPEWFDVIVTENMFGDIITDLGAITQGGMGIAAGGNINPDRGGVSMFEPIGGSAPKYTGRNVINPLASICAGGMMLDHLGEREAARSIEGAVADVCATRIKSLAAEKMGMSTSEVGDCIAERVSA